MNRHRYRLVFNCATGLLTPVAETARRAARGAAACALAASPALAELPAPGADFVAAGQAGYQRDGAQAYVNQVGSQAILNWQSFNVSAGKTVEFRQVDSLASGNPLANAAFTTLNRIHDLNPSVIAGAITQAPGQQANVILVNSNGIAFTRGAEVDLASFAASTLDLGDDFVLSGLLGDQNTPQFAGALDGGAARGFVKVFEGARLTAGRQGRVMLIAPTVANAGEISTPDGQTILAAGSRAYLRAEGDPALRGLTVEVDSPDGLADFDTPNPDVKPGVLDGQALALADGTETLGQASNTGAIAAARGNVTMIGYAVNQQGIARATTSAVANGSVYLLAKDTKVAVGANIDSARAGRVIVGAGSRSEVLPEVSDATATVDGATGAGLAQAPEVRMLGREIVVAERAAVVAPAGRVTLTALDDPSQLNPQSVSNPFNTAGAAGSATAGIEISDGALIDVSGLRDVPVAAARGAVEVELRGDELKDAPVNQQGALRGAKVYVDVERALARARAGESTLIAADSLAAYAARLERNVAERSTAGGTVTLQSTGAAHVAGTVKLSGGSVAVTPGVVNTTYLTSRGALTDLAEADAETRYDGIASRYVVDYGRWNRQEVIDLGQATRFEPGYTEGRDAGTLAVIGMSDTRIAGRILGDTVIGERQRDDGAAPLGARLVLGSNAVGADDLKDHKLNQNVLIGAPGVDDGGVLALSNALFTPGGVTRLEVYSNQAAEVREALRLQTGGTLKLAAREIAVDADLVAHSGAIELTATNNVYQPDEGATIRIGDGVTLDVSGIWTNPWREAGAPAPALDGGRIALSAQSRSESGAYLTQGRVALGAGAALRADGGATLGRDGKPVYGRGGKLALAAATLTGVGQAEWSALGVQRGGALALTARDVRVADVPDAGAALQLRPGFFTRGGMADYQLSAYDTLEIAPGAQLAPRVAHRELDGDFALRASDAALADFSRVIVRDDFVREAATLELAAAHSGVGTGTLKIGAGARVEVDPGAAIRLKARDALVVDGALVARGGAVTATLDRSSGAVNQATNQNPIWLGDAARIDVSGIARTRADSRGQLQGDVLAGGQVTLDARTGYVVARPGVVIDVSGAAPVRLAIRNEAGGLGREVGSDAGAVTLFAQEGLLFDGVLLGRAGVDGLRGGSASFSQSGPFAGPAGIGYSATSRELLLANTLAAQSDGLSPDAVIPNADSVRGRVAVAPLPAAGFDRLHFASGDGIVLADGLDIGTAATAGTGAPPLAGLTLDAARLVAAGDARLAADVIRLANDDGARRGANPETARTGELKATARWLELGGELRLTGMARAELEGSAGVRFTGARDDRQSPGAEILADADLVLRGASVAPATFTDARLIAPGRDLRIEGAGQPTNPDSAQGRLRIVARNIEQAGVLWAPHGQLDLAATGTLTLAPGSLTSVAGAPGTTTLFGKVQNGRDWIVDLDPETVPQGQIALAAPAPKAIRLDAAQVTARAGAVVDASGGGELLAYEFTAGPGGSRDVLAGPQVYAVLPGGGPFAPLNPQEPSALPTGSAIELAGVPGLADGVYTLLPAHYALLPGARAVRLADAVPDLLPSEAFTRQDGVRVAAARLTDTRAGAPVSARWQGVEVLTREQVLERSEFSFARASNFFVADRPQDAGGVAIATRGQGADALRLDAQFKLNGATVPGASAGRGAAVSIAADALEIVARERTAADPLAVRLSVESLNALGARSLILGANTEAAPDATNLIVVADRVTLANADGPALAAPEVVLAARNRVELAAGSRVVARGAADAGGVYTTSGDGALLRAGGGTVDFVRGGDVPRAQGVLVGDASAAVTAGAAVTLDATLDNAFRGAVEFDGDGRLAVGAPRMVFGEKTGAGFLGFTQDELDTLDLASLALTSYSRFDFVGDVAVGRLDASGRPLLRALTLNGGGLQGAGGAQAARLAARQLTLANPGGAGFEAVDPGGGALAIRADTLNLGVGDKAVAGFATLALDADEVVGYGLGALAVAGGVNAAVARFSGTAGSAQTLASQGDLSVGSRTPDAALAAVSALAAAWTLSGERVDFDSRLELPSGRATLTARGDLTLGAHAGIDVAGRARAFFDVSRASPGGAVELASETGQVVARDGARVDISAASSGDAGQLDIRATRGAIELARGSVAGAGGTAGDGARVSLDAGTLVHFSALNAVLDEGGVAGERRFRARGGDVVVATGDTVAAHQVEIAADDGGVRVAGRIDASGERPGAIRLVARRYVDLVAGAALEAVASDAARQGGEIELAAGEGSVNLAAGSAIDVSGAAGGRVALRALRDGDEVKIGALDAHITGARELAVEAVRVYDGVERLAASSGGTTLGLATVKADNEAYAANFAAIRARLGQTGNAAFRLKSGVEVRAPGDLALAADWNLAPLRAGGAAGELTLRAGGDLDLAAHLSDGFNVATPLSGSLPATLLADDSWGYRLIGGADLAAADPLSTRAGAGDVTLAAGKQVRTGSGDIRIAAGGDIHLLSAQSVIYTAGKLAAPLDGYTPPAANARAQFSTGGGDLSLSARGSLLGAPSTQFFNDWLFRQGGVADSGDYAPQPAWWVRFDRFAQGVAALGGGDVTLAAGDDIVHLAAHAPTQGRTTGANPASAVQQVGGGGEVRVTAGGDVLGGQFYAERGALAIRAGGDVGSAQDVFGAAVYPVLALGDARARVVAGGDVNLQGAVNPFLLAQSFGTPNTAFNVSSPTTINRRALFYSGGDASSLALESLSGAVVLHNPLGGGAVAPLANAFPVLATSEAGRLGQDDLLLYLPPHLALTAYQGDVRVFAEAAGSSLTLLPAAQARFELLAGRNVLVNASITQSDRDPASLPSALAPVPDPYGVSRPEARLLHAATPVHAGDAAPARIVALEGSVVGGRDSGGASPLIDLSKPLDLRAGQDLRDLSLRVQHANTTDQSRVQVGRDLLYGAAAQRRDGDLLHVGGPGRLEVTAGRNIDLGVSGGIVSRGDLDNANLPRGGADLVVTAAAGPNGVDYAGALTRLAAALASADPDRRDAALWQARWLSGEAALAPESAAAVVAAVAGLPAAERDARVRALLYTALKVSGRDANDPASPHAGDFARAYAALETLFPGIEAGAYSGEFKLLASRIKTERGGGIDLMQPGGDLVVGLANTPAALVAVGGNALGVVAASGGAVRGFARDDLLVNQSRILTVAGGDVLLWSSAGDIDAGKGKKTASAVPPPVVKIDSQGRVTQELQGAATGSGIGALSTGGVAAGDVDLVAPRGTVNAGDAGIRAGNLNIAAAVVLGADNISVSGSSTGTPVADTGAITAASSSANSGDGAVGDASAALADTLAEAARAAEELKQSLKPTFISAEVVGRGE